MVDMSFDCFEYINWYYFSLKRKDNVNADGICLCSVTIRLGHNQRLEFIVFKFV